MTDANVTSLHPSPASGGGPSRNALRQRRHRAKRKASVTRNATVTPTPAVTPPDATSVPVPSDGGRGVTLATTVAALALAAVSAGFSITGMTSIFVGSFWPVVGMGVALELGKLSAVAWLGRAGCERRGHPARPLKAAIVTLIAVLMGLNAVGAYGFLARAHIEHAVASDVTAAGRAADIDARISGQASVVADLDRRIAQIDTAVEKATDRGRTAVAMKLADEQRKARADLAGQRIREAKTLADLKVEKAGIDGQR